MNNQWYEVFRSTVHKQWQLLNKEHQKVNDVVGDPSDRCQGKLKTLSLVLDFLPGPQGWGWLLASTVLTAHVMFTFLTEDICRHQWQTHSNVRHTLLQRDQWRVHTGVQTTGCSTGTRRQFFSFFFFLFFIKKHCATAHSVKDSGAESSLAGLQPKILIGYVTPVVRWG